jgi:hypothetical protein
MGKVERAISVSGYVYRELIKYTDYAFNKITTYKRRSRNSISSIKSRISELATRTTSERTIFLIPSAMGSHWVSVTRKDSKRATE